MTPQVTSTHRAEAALEQTYHPVVALDVGWPPRHGILALSRGQSRRSSTPPSHHRVHHGANEQYLDRNYGGILIDRLFGSFIPESERVHYGLTNNIDTFNPVRVALGEYGAVVRDLRATSGWRMRLQVALRGPGWRPPG